MQRRSTSATPVGASLMTNLLRILSALAVAITGTVATADPAAAQDVTITYSVGSHGSVGTDVGEFAAHVRSTLDHPDGWSLGGTIDWVPVREGADVQILIAEPALIGSISGCSAEYSCHVSGTVYVNEDRWNQGAAGWSLSLDAYRHYVVNHEIGHFLELGHFDCPGAGAEAPVMMQQTIETDPCVNRTWPLPFERQLVADRYGTEVEDVDQAELEFARQAYERLLARSPEAGAAEQLAERLADGATTRVHVVDGMLASAEFDGVSAAVGRLYYAAFLRPADPDGQLHWMGQVQSGRSLTSVADDFVRSEEFDARYGTLDAREFVDQLYRNVLGRPADQQGSDYWTERLWTGELTRGGVLHHFAQSPEHRSTRGTEVLVSLTYALLLDRMGDRAGIDYWVRQLDSGAARRLDLVHSFMTSDESVL